MNNIIKILFMFLIMYSWALSAQDANPKNSIQVKFTQEFYNNWSANNPSKKSISLNAPELNSLTRSYTISSMERVFPYAGQFESRHNKHGLHLWYRITFSERTDLNEALKNLRSNEIISIAEPVYAVKNFGAETIKPRGSKMNDTYLKEQWHYFNQLSNSKYTAGCDIWAQNAWSVEAGDKEVVVAVIDGGVDVDHKDLAANMWINEDEIPNNGKDDDENGFIDDYYGYNFVANNGTIVADDHGTHVAGTVAATNNNGIGVCGVAGGTGNGDGIRIMSCEIFEGNEQTTDFGRALVYAADNGAVIAQNSWGYSQAEVYQQSILDAIDYFVANAGFDANHQPSGPIQGGLVFFASGNNGETGKWYPAYYDKVVAVGSVDANDKRSEFSNYGSWVDISAPGGYPGIYSTLKNNKYGYMMGTSMACPHVSGAAALIVSKYKHKIKPAEVISRLLNNTDPIDALNQGFEAKLGKGRLNAYKALLDTKNDGLFPNAITDLSLSKISASSIDVMFTAPGRGESNSGSVMFYDVRFSENEITNDNFNSATSFAVRHAQPAGLSELLNISNLHPGVNYFVAFKSIDHWGNVSELSNVVSFTTLQAPFLSIASEFTDTLLRSGNLTSTILISNTGQERLNYKATVDYEYWAEKNWINFRKSSDTIEIGQNSAIEMTINSLMLSDGIHKATLILTSNDPLHANLKVPLQFLIHGSTASAYLAKETLDMGTIYKGASKSMNVTLHNYTSSKGFLQVSSTLADYEGLKMENALPAFIAPGQSLDLEIVLSPDKTGVINQTISLLTNNELGSKMDIAVSASVIEPPVIELEWQEKEIVMNKGELYSLDFPIKNAGSDKLEVKFMTEIVSVQALSTELQMELGTLYMENFEGSGIPTGWDLQSEGLGWTFGTNLQSKIFNIPAHTRYAAINDDYNGEANNAMSDFLISPEISLNNIDSALLMFDSYYTGTFDMLAGVEITTDGGNNWYEISKLDPTNEWTKINIDLTPFVGKTIRIAFHANDKGVHSSGWAIDNVEVKSNYSWISTELISGNNAILPGESNEYRLKAEAKKIEQGTYKINLWALSNDPLTPRVKMPITLIVNDIANAQLQSVSVNGAQLENFNANTFVYEYFVEAGSLPVVEAVALNPDAVVEIKQATKVNGSIEERKATITVKSADGSVTRQYIILFSVITSVNEEMASAVVYPNPFNDFVVISPKNTCEGLVTISLISADGRLAHKTQHTGNKLIRLNTSTLNSGLYLLLIEDENGNKQRSYLVKK